MRSLLAVALVACLAVALPGATARAQTCSSDIQCPNGGRATAECVGDTLIVRRFVCAGLCQERIDRRESCRGVEAGRCVGNAFERVTGRCNSVLQSCEQRAERDLCVPSCSCRGGRLFISTGVCSPVSGCGRSVLACKNGCACDPEPRCL